MKYLPTSIVEPHGQTMPSQELSSTNYAKLYTSTPEPFSNWLLGSLQLLFWFVFRPTAWNKYIQQTISCISYISSFNNLRNSKLLQSLIQFYVIIPILTNLTLGLVLWRLGESSQNLLSIAVFNITFSIAFGLVNSMMPINTTEDWKFSMSFCLVGGVIFGLVEGVTFGLIGGLTFGLLFGLVLRSLGNLGLGLIFSELGSLVFKSIYSMPFDSNFCVMFSIAFGMAFGVKNYNLNLVTATFFTLIFSIFVAFPISKNEGLSLSVTPVMGVVFFLGITFYIWRPIILHPLLQLWNISLYTIEKRRSFAYSILLKIWNILFGRINLPFGKNNPKNNCDYFSLLHYNSAFWDECQRIPLYNLDAHLLFVIEHNPIEGNNAITFLNKSHQKWVVKIGEYALKFRNCEDIKSISNIHKTILIDEIEKLTDPVINIFIRTSQDIDAALNQRSNYNQRIALNSIAERLNGQLESSLQNHKKSALLFSPFVKIWLDIINNYVENLAKEVEQNQEINNPYIIAVPLTLEQVIFTGRDDIGLRIEQLILDRRRPPLLLYGQRRMGKTSLLYNIGNLLPINIIPILVDLQGAPASASDYTGFLYNLAKGMINFTKKQSALKLPHLTREDLADDPFTEFDEWLDEVEEILAENTALLMLDEFEALDTAISKGRFDEADILGMLRHLIQHRPKFKLLLAGSHTIEEYQRWASYLINVQVVHISYLKEQEARQLIEAPVQDFTLRYEPEAVTRVLQFTRCHPFLVQLLCGEIITLKNEQDPSIRRLARLADVEAGVREALKVGSFFFADIQNNQVDERGRNILRFIAGHGEGVVVSSQAIFNQFPNADNSLRLLLQRELIENVDDCYRFQVELIRRWFASSKE
ncbi:MAG TPA: ATP-binding protein [Nostocaceae cyanobacterium]|nr:ATP-binding protein [Nostocaceae cyanobacterium]